MFAIILAGGGGTRLRPLTYARRKELVPVVNRPLLEYRLLNLRQHGVADVVIACSQGMREVEDHFGDGTPLGVRIRYSYEDRPLGSGRAVKEAAREHEASGTLVVCNGDIITNVDLTAMVARHRATGATLSMSLAPVHDPWTYGVAEVDDDLRIRSFVEKPPQGQEPSNLINAGTWLWEPQMLDRIADDDTAIRDGFSERVLFPGVIADGLRVQGFTEDLWVDVGSPERYLLATRLLLERMTRDAGAEVIGREEAQVADGVEFEGMVALGRGTRIGPGARIVGPSVVGHDAIVGAGTVIEGSALWEEARTGEGARITGSIVGAFAGIGDRAVVTDAVLANGAEVPEDRMLEPGARLMPNERA
ncbi:MAG TPA: NDP-sugar synthase [Dehalococcoidia bacterium]|nr:NDP-sugar synthase [Dehalococcoidia bacterium]